MLRRFQSRAKDQGDRPTCVAFAVSAFHEFWCDCHLGKQDKVDIDLSEEYLHFCSKQRDGLSKGKGTTISAACEALGNEGQCLEVLHPYQRSSAFPVVPSSQAVSDAKRRKLSLIKRVDVDLAKLVEHFAAGVPVIGVIELFRGAFRVTGTESLPVPSPGEARIGLHAVLLMQIEQALKERNIVFLNSWGKGWGDSGFGRITEPYFSRHCRQLWSADRKVGRQ